MQAFASIKAFPDVLFQFAEWPCTRNATGLMQGPHRSCVQGKKAKINTALKHPQLRRLKQGSLSNHTADFKLSAETLKQHTSRGKYKPALNLITLL